MRGNSPVIVFIGGSTSVRLRLAPPVAPGIGPRMDGFLRQGTEIEPIRLETLADDVRYGRVPGEAELQYAPWTGLSYRRLRDLPEAADWLDGPTARLCARLRSWSPPWMSLLLISLLLLGALGQLGVELMAQAWDLEPELLYLRYFAVGSDALRVEGLPWTPFTAQLLHLSGLHFACNLPIAAYAAYRVERALGPASLLLIAAAATTTGALLVSLYSPLPVVGASLLSYGLWTAQIAIGFRFGESIPPGFRRYYGWGNFVFFAPLVAQGFMSQAAVSHWGHLGGLLGGGLAAFLIQPDILAPAALARFRRRGNLRAALIIALLPGLLCLGARLSPRLTTSPWSRWHHSDLPLSMELPEEMQGKPRQRKGLTIFATRGRPWGLFLGECGEDPEESWASMLALPAGPAHPAARPAPERPGWTLYQGLHPTPRGAVEVVQYAQFGPDGRRLCAGYAGGGEQELEISPGRRALYEEALSTLQLGPGAAQ